MEKEVEKKIRPKSTWDKKRKILKKVLSEAVERRSRQENRRRWDGLVY